MHKLIALGAAAASLGFAQSAEAILQKTAETYRDLRSCHFESVTVSTTRVGETDSRSRLEMVVAYVKPDKARVEYRYPKGGSWVRVTDGRETAQYRAWTSQFRKAAATRTDVDMLNATLLFEYQLIASRAAKPALLRSENLSVGGRPIDCWVIEVSNRTYWIDKARYIVLQEQVSDHRLTTYTLAEINGKAPDELFTLAPPEKTAAK
jgi:outer membrane lipoprotein-sorting protein